jgi:hypothetical protein
MSARLLPTYSPDPAVAPVPRHVGIIRFAPPDFTSNIDKSVGRREQQRPPRRAAGRINPAAQPAPLTLTRMGALTR